MALHIVAGQERGHGGLLHVEAIHASGGEKIEARCVHAKLTDIVILERVVILIVFGTVVPEIRPVYARHCQNPAMTRNGGRVERQNCKTKCPKKPIHDLFTLNRVFALKILCELL